MYINLFDPNQWADVTGYVVVVVMVFITLIGVFARLAASGRWADWLDDIHGRGSISDPWENGDTALRVEHGPDL